MTLLEDHHILQEKEEFYGLEDNGRLIFKWFEVDKLLNLEVYPEILKTDIKEVIKGSGIKQSVIRQ